MSKSCGLTSTFSPTNKHISFYILYQIFFRFSQGTATADGNKMAFYTDIGDIKKQKRATHVVIGIEYGKSNCGIVQQWGFT